MERRNGGSYETNERISSVEKVNKKKRKKAQGRKKEE
jgi:hypothetical protein